MEEVKMPNYRLSTLAAIGLGVLLASEAQAINLGEFEYRNSCAQCHGISGEGSGPVTDFLTETPPDLTVLQKNNGGIFPVTNVYSVIDGSAEIGVHGSSDMPLWGSRYRDRLAEDPYDAFSSEDTTIYVRTRILWLIEYLASLQVE
jgi:mono/diheme cytochrome c family protein